MASSALRSLINRYIEDLPTPSSAQASRMFPFAFLSARRISCVQAASPFTAWIARNVSIFFTSFSLSFPDTGWFYICKNEQADIWSPFHPPPVQGQNFLRCGTESDKRKSQSHSLHYQLRDYA